MFAAYDSDCDRQLDLQEFVGAMDCVCDEDTAVQLFTLIDIDRTGRINPFEFVTLWAQG